MAEPNGISAPPAHSGKANGATGNGTRSFCRRGSYATSHLTRMRLYWEQLIISMRRQCTTVSNVFEMSVTMTIVLLGGLHWLKTETTLAEMRSRAEEVECLG